MSKKAILFSGAVVLATIFTIIPLIRNADAAEPYNLISDSVYLNKKSMSERQIQTFLESKKSSLANYYDQGVNDTKKIKASRIIYNASQAWEINPQVILATLQKEQSLITKQNPESVDYRSAMGYGCPDGADCNKAYYGFANQVNMASYQFRYNYEALSGNKSFIDGDGDAHGVGSFACNQADGHNKPPFYNKALRPGNTVTFSRNTAISGTKDRTVAIVNKATSSLLCYTPHVGPFSTTGYSGSDNFVFFFRQWFGDPVDEYKYRFEDLVGTSGVIKKSISSGAPSETVTIENEIYNFYYDSVSKSLKLAHWNGTRWSDSIIDGKLATTGGSSKVDLNISKISGFNYKGGVQLFYYDTISKTIKHLFKKTNAFKIETLDGSTSSVIGVKRNVGTEISSLVRNGNDIQLFYYNVDNKSLEHTWWDSKRGTWRTETLDGTSSSLLKRTNNVGSEVESMIDAYNGIQLFYYNVDNKSLEHTWWDSKRGTWRTETLDGTSSSLLKRTNNVGSEVSGTLLSGNVQLFYHDITTGELIHTWWDSKRSSWRTERMDGDTNTVLGNYINSGKRIDVTQFRGRMFVAYYDDASIFADAKSSWRLAYWSGSEWVQNTLEGGGDGLSNPTKSMPLADISIESFNNTSLQIFYKGAESQLRHVWLAK